MPGPPNDNDQPPQIYSCYSGAASLNNQEGRIRQFETTCVFCDLQLTDIQNSCAVHAEQIIDGHSEFLCCARRTNNSVAAWFLSAGSLALPERGTLDGALRVPFTHRWPGAGQRAVLASVQGMSSLLANALGGSSRRVYDGRATWAKASAGGSRGSATLW